MLEALSRELITWLGYLQRTTVLVQVAIVVITVVLDKRSRLTRRVNSELLRSLSPLIAPGLLIALGFVMKLVGVPGGYLQYLALLWLIWRLIEPANLLLSRRFPKLPIEELDRSLFRPILLVFSVLSVGACPAGWMGTEGGDYCYLVSRVPMNWYASQQVNMTNKKYLYSTVDLCNPVTDP